MGRRKYVQTLRGTRAQQRHVDLAVAGLHPDTRRALVHVVGSVLGRVRAGGWGRGRPPAVPVSADFVREHFPGAELGYLVASGVLFAVAHERALGLSREYGVDGGWLLGFVDGAGGAEAALAEGVRDLATGRPSARPAGHWLSGQNGVYCPDLAARAARSVGRSLFDGPAVEAHLRRLRAAADGPDAGGPDGRRGALARYLTDAACYAGVLGQSVRPEPTEGPGVFSYQPAYMPQRFGRLTERGGGLQSCSRAMKAAARAGVRGCHNGDCVAAHPSLLAVLMGRAGVDPAWLRAYLGDPGAEARYAGAVGVPVSVWKRAFLAVVTGATVPAAGRLEGSAGEVARAFRDGVGPDEVDGAYGRFLEATGGLRAELARWHRHLVEEWVPGTATVVGANGGRRYVTNAAGATVAVDDLAPVGEPHRLVPRLTAFVLQGAEAAVVHRIAASSASYGFEVWSHEHDGLVTRGAVPEGAVEAAVRDAGFPPGTVRYVEKPFL